ncbi:hypothetical protein AJ80_04748 [Polytolypa hystricis UAMH7299]|uniref:F-box domain-containing protein n=1 Tax=Polytolypa hystricis (strain UAMH7299) TaxID=1447883 RepID=A0A2B7Y8N8_POLH7|nr:hypothetical protein AJ80_04748 [Polytolypa hystricis UAMH7299]
MEAISSLLGTMKSLPSTDRFFTIAVCVPPAVLSISLPSFSTTQFPIPRRPTLSDLVQLFQSTNWLLGPCIAPRTSSPSSSSSSSSGGGTTRSTSLFQVLPLEILLEICSFLRPSSQVCFALINKHFYALLHQLLQSSPTLHFPSEQPRDFYYINSHPSLARFYRFERWELLRLFELDQPGRWQECSRCFKLHAPENFVVGGGGGAAAAAASYMRPASPLCKYGYCAGLVDFCPCKKISVQDRERIVGYLVNEGKAEGEKQHEISVDTAPLVPRKYISHKCSVAYDTGILDVELSLFLEGGRLYMLTWYNVWYFKKGRYGMPRLVCPHNLVDEWPQARILCRQHYHPAYESCALCRRPRFCKLCNTVSGSLSPLTEENESAEGWSFWTLRDLEHGLYCHVPGYICCWREQSVFPALTMDEVPVPRPPVRVFADMFYPGVWTYRAAATNRRKLLKRTMLSVEVNPSFSILLEDLLGS